MIKKICYKIHTLPSSLGQTQKLKLSLKCVNNAIILMFNVTCIHFTFPSFELSKQLHKMKIKLVSLMIVVLSFTILPSRSNAQTETVFPSELSSHNKNAAQAKVLISRIYAINALDKSKLSSKEKHELKQEVRGIKDKLKNLDSGVYISVSAIIIILLLLILLT